MKTSREINDWLGIIRSSDDVIKSCREALKDHPQSAELWNAYGEMLEQSGNSDEAELAFEQSVLIAPGNALVWNRLGLLQKKHGQVGKSEASFLKAILVDPNLPNLREESRDTSNGNANVPQMETVPAANGNRNLTVLKTFEASVWLSVFDEFLQAGEHERAGKIMAKAYQIHSDDQDICMEYATTLEQLKRTEESRNVLKRLLEIHPDNAEAWKRLGLMAYTEGYQEDAIAILRRAVAVTHANQCIRILALMLDEQGKTSEAIRLLSEDRSDSESLNLSGVLQHKSGDKEAALSSYEEALRVGGSDSSIQNNLGRLLEDMGDDEGAAWAFDKAVELDKCNAVAWNNLGLALRRQEFFFEAEKAFRLSISLAPYFKNPWLNLRDLSFTLPSLSQTIVSDPRFNDPPPSKWTQLGWNVHDEIHHSLQLKRLMNRTEYQHEDPDELHQLALCLFNARLYNEAGELLRRAIAVEEENAARWNFLGIICEKLSNKVDSIACYERALEYDKNYIGAIFNLREAQSSL